MIESPLNRHAGPIAVIAGGLSAERLVASSQPPEQELDIGSPSR